MKQPQVTTASAVLAAIALLVFANDSLATNYYVAPGGSDTSPGTRSQPLATLQRGANLAQPGDTVIALDGHYAGFSVPRGGTSEANRIVFKSENLHGAVIDQPCNDGENHVVVYSLKNCLPDHSRDYVTIDGFRIENAPYRGISLFGTVGLHVRNCYIYACKDGAQGSNNKDTVFEGNVFDSNARDTQYYHHLYLSEGACCETSAPMSGIRIVNNTFKDAQVGSALQFMSHTPGFKYEDVIIEGNRFLYNAGKDINSVGLRLAHIRNNVFVTNYGGLGCINIERAGPLNCGTPDSPDNLYVYNNTFICPNTRGIYFRDIASLGPLDATGCVVFNNLVFAQTAAMAIVDDSSTGQSIAGNLTYGFNDSNIQSILAATFEDYQNNDLRLRDGAPAIDAGMSSLDGIAAPTTDMAGTSRPPNAVDVGAYEYGAAPPPEEPLAAPQGVGVDESTLGCLDVSWQANGEVSLAGYRVYFGTIPGIYSDSTDVGALTSAQVCGLVGRHFVAVRAYSVTGKLSPPSSEETLFVLGSTPISTFNVAYWNLDQGTGGVADDSWGNADGVLTNGPTWENAGAVSGALRFDGVDDMVSAGALDVPDGPGFSIALWVNADDFEVPDARLVSKATGTSEQAHYWMLSTIDQTGIRFRLRTNGQTTTLQTAAGQLQAGRWYHVAATYDGNDMRLYKDGQEVASTAKTGIVDTDPGVAVAVGNQPSGAGSLPFDGMIDDVRLYRRALSSAEIAALIAMQTNAAPVATFSATPTTGTAPVTVSFDASASSDPEGGSLTFEWDFDDGTNGTGEVTEHTYTLGGAYTARLTVTDDHGNTATHEEQINVGEQTSPPAIPTLELATEDSPACVTVTWLPNSELDLAGYILAYATASVANGDATSYDQSLTLGAVTSWRGCSFEQGRYYFALRARNTSGQLSGYSQEIALDVAGPDVTGPIVIPLAPGDGATNVALDASVRFVVLDERSNVDTGNLVVRIDGRTPGNVQITPASVGFTVECTPAQNYAPISNVVVDVAARDTATQPNASAASWSFTTVSVPPAAPTGLVTAGTDTGSVDVTWNANTEPDLAGYRLYFGTASNSYDDSLTVGNTTSVMVGGLTEGTYYFRLCARNASGQLGPRSAETSAQVTVTTPGDLSPPQGVQVAQPQPGCMRVTWHAGDNPSINGYVVYYGNLSVAQGQTGIYFNTIDVRRNTSGEVCDLSSDTYYVAVRAYDSQNQFSPFSTEKNVEVTAPDATAPAVSLAYPRNGAVEVPQNVQAFLVFSDDDAGIDTTSVSIRIGNMTPTHVEYTGDLNNLGAVCELPSPLPGHSVVSVDVTVTDRATPPNTTTRSWSFTTGDAADLTPPVFLSYEPADGAEHVAADAAISAEIDDDTGIDHSRVQMFINGSEVEVDVENAGGNRVAVHPRAAELLPSGDVEVHVVAYDLSDNRSELRYGFTVDGFDKGTVAAEDMGKIVPDGFWADEPNRPLEVHNLPLGWSVHIFTTSGVKVRSFENHDEDDVTWTWDFANDSGQEVSRALYLVRVVDANGNVQQSGKFVVRLQK